MRSFKSVYLVVALACVLQAGMVYAAPVHGPTAKVVGTRADKGDVGYIYLAEPICIVDCGCISSTHRNMIVVDLNTAGGKTMMSIAMAAQVSGKMLKVEYYDECTIDSTVADAANVSLVE